VLKPLQGRLGVATGASPWKATSPTPIFLFSFLSPIGAIEIQSPLAGLTGKEKRGGSLSPPTQGWPACGWLAPWATIKRPVGAFCGNTSSTVVCHGRSRPAVRFESGCHWRLARQCVPRRGATVGPACPEPVEGSHAFATKACHTPTAIGKVNGDGKDSSVMSSELPEIPLSISRNSPQQAWRSRTSWGSCKACLRSVLAVLRKNSTAVRSSFRTRWSPLNFGSRP